MQGKNTAVNSRQHSWVTIADKKIQMRNCNNSVRKDLLRFWYCNSWKAFATNGNRDHNFTFQRTNSWGYLSKGCKARLDSTPEKLTRIGMNAISHWTESSTLQRNDIKEIASEDSLSKIQMVCYDMNSQTMTVNARYLQQLYRFYLGAFFFILPLSPP